MFLHSITKTLIVITVLVQCCNSKKCYATPVENDNGIKTKNMSEVIIACEDGNDDFCFKSIRKGKGHILPDDKSLRVFICICPRYCERNSCHKTFLLSSGFPA